MTILQTTDVHAQVESSKRGGGWLNAATVINRERSKSPNSTLLIDCGDSIQGSFAARVTEGKIAIDIMNHLEYDVWVPGNHEFDFGFKRLLGLSKMSKASVLAANILTPKKDPVFKPWTLITKNGIRIAVIGFTSPLKASLYSHPQPIGYSIEDIRPTLEYYISEIMEMHPDVIICALHHSLKNSYHDDNNNLFKMALDFPQIDIFLGGHLHQFDHGRRIGVRSWFVQAGSHGRSVAKIECIVDITKHRITHLQSKLIGVDKRIKKDGGLHGLLQKQLRFSDKKRALVVGYQNETLYPPKKRDPYSLKQSNTARLFHRAILSSVDADIALHSARSKHPFRKGLVTLENLYYLSPFEDTIFVLEMTRQEFVDVLNEQIRRSRSHHTLYPSGNVVFTVKKKKISSLVVDGKTWRDGESKLVAVSGYVFTGARGHQKAFSKLYQVNKENAYDTTMKIYELLIEYFSRKNND